MENFTKNSITIKNLRILTKRYLNSLLTSILFLFFIGTPICHGKSIKTSLVNDKEIATALAKDAKRVSPVGAIVEKSQIVSISDGNNLFYAVPVLINSDEQRGCYIYEYDKRLKLTKKLLFSELQEAESCETVSAIFSCNRAEGPLSGIAILYGKRLGANHYWFEGSYFNVDPKRDLVPDEARSELLTDVDTVAKAKKKLGCR